jgi:hypothetical protein
MSKIIYVVPNDGFRRGLGGTPMFWANKSHIRGGTAELSVTVDDISYLGYAMGYGHFGWPVHGGMRVRVPALTPLALDVDWHMTEQQPPENNIPPKNIGEWCNAIKLARPATILTGYHAPLQPLNDHWDWSIHQVVDWMNANGRATYNKWLDIFPIRMPLYSQPEERKKQFDILPHMIDVANEYAATFGSGKKVFIWTWPIYRDYMPMPPNEMNENAKFLMSLPGIGGLIVWGGADILPGFISTCEEYL